MTDVGSVILCLLQFIDDSCFQIEKYERNARTFGVLAYIPRSVLHVLYLLYLRAYFLLYLLF